MLAVLLCAAALSACGSEDESVRSGVLPVGGGGFVTGMSMSDDGKTRLVRTDTFGGYRWNGRSWVLDTSSDDLPSSVVRPGLGDGVLDVAVAPSDSEVAYMAWDDAVFRSNDGARSWTRVASGITTQPQDDFRTWGPRLTVDPVDSRVVYYGTQRDGLLSSRDGGAHWRRVAETGVPRGLEVPLTGAKRGALTTATGKDRSGTPVATAGVDVVAVDPRVTTQGRSAVVFAASFGNGIYRSGDGGTTWSRISPSGLRVVQSMQVLPGGGLIAVGRSDPAAQGKPSQVWRCVDGRWDLATPPQAMPWHSVAVDRRTPGLVAMVADGGQVALSSDEGATWRLVPRTQRSSRDVPWLARSLNEGNSYMSPGGLQFDPTRAGRLWMTEGTGVWGADISRSSDRVEWTSRTRAIEQLVPNDTVAAPGHAPVLAAWDRALFRATSLHRYPTGYAPSIEFNSAWSVDWAGSSPGYLTATVASQLYPWDPRRSGYSRDGGRTWHAFATIPEASTNALGTFGYGTVAAGAPGNVVWVPSSGRPPYFTVDNGDSWQRLVLPGVSDYSQVDAQPFYVNRRVVAADKATPGTFYVLVVGKGVFRSDDGARSWTQVCDYRPFAASDFGLDVTLKAVPGRAGELYLSPGELNGDHRAPFLHSTDGGRSWRRVSGVTGVTAFGFGKPEEDGDPTIFAAGYLRGRYGVLYSGDGGASWRRLLRYPAGRTAAVTSLDGDKNISGRAYLALRGGGWTWVQVGPAT